MIIRTKKNSNYTVINNSVLEDTRLSWRAKGIAAFLLSKPDNWEINHTYLWKHGKEGRDAILAAMKELEQCGYLIRTRTQGKDGKFSTEVVLIEEPTTDFQKSVNQDSVNQKSVFQNSLVSTEEVSTEEQQLPIQNGSGGSSRKKKPPAKVRGAVHTCWQQNIPGTLTPIIVEQLDDLIDEFGAESLIHAITVAVNANIRTMRYIKGVLDNTNKAAQPTNNKPQSLQRMEGEEW